MTKIKLISRRSFMDSSRRLLTVVVCLLAMAGAGFAQGSITDTTTPAGYTAGAPVGTYSLSGFENINFFNGNLNFSLPFLQLQGRGGSGHALVLKRENKWTMFKGPAYFYAHSNGWQNLQAGYGAGALGGRMAGVDPLAECYAGKEEERLLRLTFTSPDGTEYELRDQATNGASGLTIYSENCVLQGTVNRGKIFITSDGSAATFISDVAITDASDAGYQPTGYFMLRDGTRFRISAGKVEWMRDRNGNRTTYTFTNNQVTQVVDSLGRSVTISYRQSGSNPDTITYKGSGAESRTVRIWYAPLNDARRSDYELKTYRQLFPELNGTSTVNYYNAYVVSSVELPDGRRYWLRYNSYGELARVELPTGGAFEYDWEGGLTGGTASGVMLYHGSNIYRRVVERRVYDNGASGSNYTSRMTISKPENATSGNLGYVIVEQRNAAGTLLTKEQHYYHGSARDSFDQDPLGYGKWKEGKEWKTEVFASNGTTVLRLIEHTWQQPTASTTWPLTAAETSDNVKANDPQITQTVMTLVDSNQVSKQTFAYDKYCNKTDVYEHDYGSGSAPPSWVRRTHTDYLTTNPVNSLAYDTVNPSTSSPSVSDTFHLRSLPTQTKVFDASNNEKSRATFEYDYYVNTAPRALLLPRSGISGLDGASTTSYTPRGNVTRSTNWILTTSTEVHSYPQYDIAGNVVKNTDPLGNATDFYFDDRFGSPNGEAQANTPPSELVGNSSFAFVTKVINAANHITYTQYDYYLGRAVDTEDANGVVSSVYSVDDDLDRPTKVIRAVGTAAQNQTLFTYNDTAKTITTASDHTSFNDSNPLKSLLVYDNLGRTIETRQYEGGTNYIVTQQQYDTLGRVHKTSNPFRPWQSESALWTTTGFDALGRVTTVTTPDNAVVNTSYSGNTVTVTDQAGKKRRSVTDGLGRLVRVDEPDANNNLDSGGSPIQPTNYSYDVLDNLTAMTQGTQTRTFGYDSLKRLTGATNPESGTIAYQYDNNSNLLVKTDARSVSTHFSYDALNRAVRRWYNGSSSLTATTHNNPALPSGVGATDEAKYFYDSQSLPAGAPSYTRGSATGRLVATTYGNSSSTGDYFAYDVLGRATLKIQQLGGINYQVQRSYNLASGVVSQTYPSGRTVSYTYDSAGRSASFGGTLGDSVNRTYATGINYSVWGGLSREQFGTDISLYHRQHYTNRGQQFDTRVSTVDDGSWNRGAIVNYYSLANFGFGNTGTDTNGNVYIQQHYIPHDDQMIAWTMQQQNYDYDSLNRITWVGEYLFGSAITGSQTGAQHFLYDRWGNRRINPITWGTGINNKQFEVNTANNRLVVPTGQSGVMSYDSAGNLATDSYTGAGNRWYDAENRMISAQGVNQGNYQYYSYNADGQRIIRTVEGVATWQVYGIDSELLAEYAGNGSATSPQKEYGYRNGELLVAAEPSAQIKWLVSDHLGTPRMIFDKSGALANVKRHDYLPFGEELFAGVGGRTTQNGYSADTVRQKFTSKERDNETGLDYFFARYYASPQGRFTSPDEFTGGPTELFAEVAAHNPTFYSEIGEPQSLNKYQYALNNPLKFVDPDGHQGVMADAVRQWWPVVVVIPGAPAVLAGGAALFIIATAIDAIPGDKTAGDGSCPSCQGALEAGQRRMAQQEAAKQNILNKNNSGDEGQGQKQGGQQRENAQQAPGQKPDDKGRTGGRNQPKDRSASGTMQQEKEIEAKRDKTTQEGGYRISKEKSTQNRKTALKKIRRLEDAKEDQ
jgi:RHS repeat-associated protein